MTRILLLCPPITIRGHDTTTPGAMPPLGLASVAAYLETHGFDVKIIDTFTEGSNTVIHKKDSVRVGLTPNQIKQSISYFRPQIVGITSMFTAYSQDAHDLAKIVKSVNPKILVVFGGAHASILPKLVLKDKNVDLVVIGEGELTMFKIAARFENNQKLTNLLGTALRDHHGKIIINSPRPHIPNLDSLPPPARHLLPMDLYLNSTKNNHSFSYRSPLTVMITSRGCPGNCIYCAVPGIWGRTWRPYSAKRVVDEIQSLVDRYGVREIHFLDDNVSVSRERLENICDLIISRKIDIKWTTPNGIAIWTLDRPLLEKMKKSGCYRLTFGIETGHPETQKFIRKNLNLDKAKKIIKIASDLGLWTFSTYIIGFPYETEKLIKSTFDYAIKSYSDFVVFIILIPFPETEVTKIMLKEKILKNFQLTSSYIGETFSGYHGVGNKFLSADQIKMLHNNADKQLMQSRLLWSIFRPSVIINKIHNREDFFYFLKVINNFLTMFFSRLKFGELKTHRLQAAKKYQIIK
jgi:anaerobic magnesium-protoporphyrin IX monomethyl ester cyclase